MINLLNLIFTILGHAEENVSVFLARDTINLFQTILQTTYHFFFDDKTKINRNIHIHIQISSEFYLSETLTGGCKKGSSQLGKNSHANYLTLHSLKSNRS